MKLLSVIIPMYNSAKWLPKCLDSILNQDIAEDDLEIVCINDGGPDNSEEIARQYQLLHPASIVVLTQENQGPSGARNNGMKHSTGKYLCFVDPDDFVEPNVFGGLLKQMEEQKLDILRFNYQIVDEEYKPVKKRDFELKFDYSPCIMTGADFLANRLDIACHIWKYMYRTELVISNQIWCFTGDYIDDAPWLPMVLLKTGRLGVCGKVVYNYQDRSDSLVRISNRPAMIRKQEGILLLIRILNEELAVIKGGVTERLNMGCLRDVKLSNVELNKIEQWYKMMISFGAVSLLTITAVYTFDARNSNLNQLQMLGVFPLMYHDRISLSKRRIQLFNMCPRMTMWYIHIKNLAKDNVIKHSK